MEWLQQFFFTLVTTIILMRIADRDRTSYQKHGSILVLTIFFCIFFPFLSGGSGDSEGYGHSSLSKGRTIYIQWEGYWMCPLLGQFFINSACQFWLQGDNLVTFSSFSSLLFCTQQERILQHLKHIQPIIIFPLVGNWKDCTAKMMVCFWKARTINRESNCSTLGYIYNNVVPTQQSNNHDYAQLGTDSFLLTCCLYNCPLCKSL